MRESQSALIVIDVQNDFCPGGALAVTGGDQVIPVINRLIETAGTVILTQDWHPADHTSFAANHPGAAPYSQTQMDYGAQTLWPVHCVQGSPGADFAPALRQDRADLVLRKGFRRAIDSYSAFFENDRRTVTGLDGYLRARGIEELVLAGLATDFCVAFSALDAVGLGYRVRVRLDGCRGIDLGGSLAAMTHAMRDAGVILEG